MDAPPTSRSADLEDEVLDLQLVERDFETRGRLGPSRARVDVIRLPFAPVDPEPKLVVALDENLCLARCDFRFGRDSIYVSRVAGASGVYDP